jgi:hypothetical protein
MSSPNQTSTANPLTGLGSLLSPALRDQANTLSALAFTELRPPQRLQWIAVRPRFTQFHQNLALTPLQKLDGMRKRAGVVGCLNSAYYGTASETDNSFFVGSWGKDTMTRPPRDVDVYFLLSLEVYHRFQTRLWNRQSGLLQEVKEQLAVTYPKTDISGDGQVVMVRFDSYCVEVVPAFTANGRYWICDTHNGGSYKETAPWAEVNHIDGADRANSGNLRPLIRMLKAWKAWCKVPIKSFHLELLAADFLSQSPWRLKDYFWFDWLTRDFFGFLCGRGNGHVVVPGTNEVMALGNEWFSRAVSAHQRATKACDYERDNWAAAAGDEWQKIFGLDIPLTV